MESGRVRTGQLQRALEGMTIGVHQGALFRKRTLADGHTGEYEQQVQVQLGGTAGNEWGFVDSEVTFELPFVYAPLQRRSEFTTPHFTRGIEVLNSAPDPTTLLNIDAHVVGWTTTEEGFIVGARVRFSVCAPNATDNVPYTAIAHLAFQGYASYAEGDEFTS